MSLINEEQIRESAPDLITHSIALGSTTELQNQLLVAKDVGYLSLEDFCKIFTIPLSASTSTKSPSLRT